MFNFLICYAINLVWNSLRRLVKRETVCEIRKLYQTRLCRYYLFKNEYIAYNIICTIQFNDFSILATIISLDYLNLFMANKYISAIPTQVINIGSIC